MHYKPGYVMATLVTKNIGDIFVGLFNRKHEIWWITKVNYNRNVSKVVEIVSVTC